MLAQTFADMTELLDPMTEGLVAAALIGGFVLGWSLGGWGRP